MSRWAVANPRKTLVAWGAIVCALGIVGLGVDTRLHRSNVLIDSTAAGKAQALQTQRFGEGSDSIILLQGPSSALNEQGPRLIRALDRQRDVSVVSPWTPGLRRSLRPRSDQAILLARIHEPFEQASRYAVPRMRRVLDRVTGRPVSAHLTGYADIAHATYAETVKAVRSAELIAAPLLLIILLLVFRSPVAAAVPLLLGMTTVGAATGCLDLINRLTPLDAVALNLASMLGLALGVDYSLLMVFRFREELAKGGEARFAAQTASLTAGHTVRFAGLALGAAMLAALLVTPGTILLSLVAGTLIAVVISVLTASVGLPAILALLGRGIDRWRFGRSREGPTVAAMAIAVLRRPALTGGLVLLVLVLLAIPAFAIESGPPDPRALPDSSRARADFAAIRKSLRGNWAAPYEVTIATQRGAITSRARLAAIETWQRQLAGNRRVDVVLGPGSISEQAKTISGGKQDLRSGRAQLASSQKALGRFNTGLGRAAAATQLLEGGLSKASHGAQRLALGGARGATGAARLATGMSRAARGVSRLQAGINRSSPALRRLASGAGRAARGTGRIRRGVLRIATAAQEGLPQIAQLRQSLLDAGTKFDQLRQPIAIANQQMDALRSALAQMGPAAKADPQYPNATQALDSLQAALSGRAPGTGAAIAPGYDGVDAALQTASAGAQQAADGVSQILDQSFQLLNGTSRLSRGTGLLRQGLERISAGSKRLSDGGGKAAGGAAQLGHGLSRLRGGSGALSQGLDRLQDGASRLADGLSAGGAKTARLASGAARLKRGGKRFQTRTARFQRQFEGTKRLGRILVSPYATLAALDTATPGSRTAASTAVNLDQGGNAARVLVVGDGRVPPHAPTRPGDPLRKVIERSSAPLSRQLGADVRVGGPAATLQDLDTAITGALPWLVVLLCAVTYVVLVPLLRSLLLPLLAVALNLLTVATALGVLTLGFQGSAPLGGPGFIDDLMLTTVFSVVLALSIDYQVFLLARMREGYDLTGDPSQAIEYGLRHTAGVVTGAALIMSGVFIAFALSPIIGLRELGVGLTVAVLLDATLVRLVLLPAAMRLLGPRIWWLPGWLERFLPSKRNPKGNGRASIPPNRQLTTSAHGS